MHSRSGDLHYLIYYTLVSRIHNVSGTQLQRLLQSLGMHINRDDRAGSNQVRRHDRA